MVMLIVWRRLSLRIRISLHIFSVLPIALNITIQKIKLALSDTRPSVGRFSRSTPAAASTTARCFVTGGSLRSCRLFLSASLSLFLLLCARAATRIDPETGAAHQVIRQVWIFTALFLDAYAAAAQSLVGYFFGAGRLALARRVAAIAALWSVGTGFALAERRLRKAASKGVYKKTTVSRSISRLAKAVASV